MGFAKTLIQKFVPIDIVYKPVKKFTGIINCYFSNKLTFAFRSTFSENFVQITMVEKISLINILTVALEDLGMFIISILKVW